MTNQLFNSLNIAVIGCGNWGKNLIRVFNQLGSLYAVCDQDPIAASRFSEQYGVPRYTFEKILEDTKIDAIVIATPSVTHFELASAAIKAGKHTFVEKPLAVTYNHALKLHNLAEKYKKVFMVGHLLQYHAVFQKLKQLNSEGVFGKLQYIYSNRLNLGKFRAEENIWWDYAPHDVSMILALVGAEPTSVNALGGDFLQHTVTDVTSTQLHFPDNIKAHIFVSWLHPFKEQKFVVVGDKAMAVFNDCNPWETKLCIYNYPSDWIDGLPRPCISKPEPVTIPQSEPLINECTHFCECIINTKLNDEKGVVAPRTGSKEGMSVMKVLNAAIESIQQQRPIDLEKFEQERFAQIAINAAEKSNTNSADIVNIEPKKA